MHHSQKSLTFAARLIVCSSNVTGSLHLGMPRKFARALIACVSFIALCVLCVAPTSAQTPYKYNAVFVDGHGELFVYMQYDPPTDGVYAMHDDTSTVRLLHRKDVRTVYTIADPLRPPREVPWDSLRGTKPLPSDACDCLGHERSMVFHLLDAKLGLSVKGKSTYAQVTPAGPVQQNSVFFNPFNKGSTILDVEAGAAFGWRVNHWDLGAQVEVIPTDGFFYFPVSLHARYYFDNDCCTWNLFINGGIPFDFQTGAPIFITPLFDRRQRRYFSAGIGKIWPLTDSRDFAIDLGYRYMVIPLEQIQCCPSIDFQNRFPARESQSLFLQIGYAF